MRYSGILRIGFKLLVNDRGKFFALLIGITFAVFLMMEMTAMFAGILNRAFSPVTNIGAAMWIMDPAVNTATSPIPMPDYVLDAARSMDGVSYAVPLFMGGALVKLASGTYQGVNVVGLDDSSLFGRPELNRATFRTSMPTIRSLWWMTLNSPSWETRRSARPLNSMTIAARLWASPKSPPTG
jgi:putative ABC transport system permease protein